jgi:N-acetylmuramoyl-L-alanine amidase
MAIFGRPDFQGDFDALAANAPPWLNNPLAFLMSALQQGPAAATPDTAIPGIMGGLGRGAPTGPSIPAFGMQGSIDPTGSSGITPGAPLSGGIGLPATPSPARQPPIPGIDPMQPGGIPLDMGAAGGGAMPPLPKIPPVTAGAEPLTDPMSGLPLQGTIPTLNPGKAIARALGPPGGGGPAFTGSEPFTDPMTGLSLSGEGIPPEVPGKPISPFERDLRRLHKAGSVGETATSATTAAKTALEKYFSVPPASEAGFGDWTPPPEAEETVPGQPLPPFSKAMPPKTGTMPATGGGTYQVPAGGTAAPEARIKVSPQGREAMIRTTLGEAGNEPQKGKEAVAHVIINRALENKPEFGGSDVSNVVTKPYQFEPHNTAKGRAAMAAYSTDSKAYKDAAKAVDDAISGASPDPTGGSTFFYSPKGQAQLGRGTPNWATPERYATTIAGHKFYYGTTGTPLPPPAGAKEGEVTELPNQDKVNVLNAKDRAAVTAMYPTEGGEPPVPDTSGRVTPQPPMLPMPPGQAQTPRTDFSAVRAMLDKAGYITPGENMANVLAGLARGAGSVASNAPGSFASALAAAGAGGEGAFATGLKEGRQAIGARAAAEIPLLSTEREQAKDYTAVEYQNATAKYSTAVQNLNNDFAGRKQEFSFLQPDIKWDANGMHVSRYNPATGQVEIQNVPLRDKIQQYESLSAMAKALGMDHPYVRMKIGQMQLDEMPEELRAGYIKQLIVQDVISQKAGGTVFKDAWTKALKQAEKQIPPEMRSKGPEYDAERDAIAKSIILNDPSINNPSWIADAARVGSPFAAWLLPLITPQKAPAKKREETYSGY